MIRNLFLAGVAIFVCYHFWPEQTKDTGKKIADKSVRAAKEIAK